MTADRDALLVPGGGRAVDLQVQHKTAGLRLDRFLVIHCPDYSRSLLQKAIEAQCVLVNDAAAKASHKLKAGDRVRIWLPKPDRPEPTPENIPLEILYEDEWLALINKPYNMVVHP
ncbi:MAG: S4 domain-containing protein, partial [Gemmataceae bacterium]|nr:S4 domain-containing protein [Gemmataceae bacterium]